ncbi:MAG: PEP-CTERM sorting domain-containing protein [Phycisphaerae bacterium]|jgi:hypothetical protein
MKKLIVMAVIVLMFNGLTQASVIAKYEFGDYPSYTLDPSIQGEHIIASDFGYFGDGTTDFADHSENGGAYQAYGGWPDDEYTADYFHFTITIEPGWSLDLDKQSIWFDASIGSMTGPWSAKVTYLGSSEIPIGNEFEIGGGWYTYKTYQSVPSAGLTGEVEFRIYGNDATSGGSFSIDNVILNGSINQIPEPATMCLLGLGALSLLRRNRRFR